MNKELIAGCIDHTLLIPNANVAQINKLCEEAINYGFFSVCINPSFIDHVAKLLNNSSVKICSVVGFPLGTNTSSTKKQEIETALNDGANEIDMVMNIGFIKDKEFKKLENEFMMARKITGKNILKIIIETCLLSKNEIIHASKIIENSGADYIKTSTGFSKKGATCNNIILIKNSVGTKIKIKASGGINSFYQVKNMLKAGASRIGTSSGVIIIGEIP